MCLNRWPLPCRRAAFYHRLLCACLINQQGCHGDGGGGAGPKNGPGLCAPWPTYSAVCQHIQRQTGWMGDTFTRITGGEKHSPALNTVGTAKTTWLHPTSLLEDLLEHLPSAERNSFRLNWTLQFRKKIWELDSTDCILSILKFSFRVRIASTSVLLTVNPLFLCTFQTHQL